MTDFAYQNRTKLVATYEFLRSKVMILSSSVIESHFKLVVEWTIRSSSGVLGGANVSLVCALPLRHMVGCALATIILLLEPLYARA